MSGSGGDRSDYSTAVGGGGARPGGGGGGSGGSGGGGSGRGEDDPCAISQRAPINSPNPAIVSALAVGEVLNVVLTGTPPRRVLQVRRQGGGTAGSLTHRGHLSLIRCIDLGNSYQAQVLQITGGVVIVGIERV